MSDGNNENSQGCFIVVVLIMTVVLMMLISMCMSKVKLSFDLSTLPKETTEEASPEVTDEEPEETKKPTEDEPSEEEKPAEETEKPTEETTEETTEDPSEETSEEIAEPTEEATEPVTTPIETEAAVMRVVKTAAALAEAKDGAKKVATLDTGTEVSVLGEKNQYSILQVEGETCYMPTEYLRESGKYLVVIDAGHQQKGNPDTEPVGPGATEEKAKVTSGAQGVETGLEEYKLNLLVAKKLQAILEKRGYQVVMVRTKHKVDISNAERARIANDLNADAVIHIHANSDTDPETSGIMTLCQTKSSPYNSGLYKPCRRLSECVLLETAEATGGKKRAIWETDTMSSINYSQVPVTIVEMGFMSNPEEDKLMATDAYQDKLAEGIANGIDRYFE